MSDWLKKCALCELCIILSYDLHLFHKTVNLNVAGVASEGLYRVAGFHDDVEAIKMAFDKGNC